MEDKKAHITEKVAQMFLDYGIRGVTMDDVSHRLGISKKTLYQYFQDKNQLVEAVLIHIANNRFKDFAEIENQGNAIEQLLCYMKIQLKMIKSYKPAFAYDLHKYYPDLFEKFQNLKLEKMIETVKRNTKTGVEQGLYRSDLDIDIIARLTVLRAETIINSEFFTQEEFHSTNLFKEIIKYHIYGVVSDKGRELVNNKLHEFNNDENN